VVTLATSARRSAADEAGSSPGASSSTRLPTPTFTLACALAFLLGAGVLAAAFDPGLASRTQSILFWSGLGLSLCATVAVGVRRNAREWERMTSLAAFGALLYLPYVLRSPEHPIYGVELFQLQSARLLGETGHTPVVFPGMDFVALWLHDVTGLGIENVTRVVPLAVHVVAPLLVFGIARALRLGARASFLAGLIYVSNPAFFFLHSAFSQETLGIVLFLGAWAAVVACADDRRAVAAYAPVIFALVAGAVVTHHLSALMIAAGFVVFAVVVAVSYRDAVGDVVALAVGSIVLLNVWLVVHADTATQYVSAAFGSGIDSLVDALKQENQLRGDPFGTHSLGGLEQLVAYLAPCLALLLCLAGIYLLWRRSWPRGPAALLTALLIFGPVAWTVTAPAVVSGTSDLVLRTWPFLFLGIALYAASGLRGLDGVPSLTPTLRRGIVLAVLGCLVAGGIVIGDNIGGRFPRPEPSTSAGPESVSDDAIAAAEWLSATAGRDKPFVGDLGSELVFGTYGDQQTLAHDGAVPLVAETPEEIAARLRRLGASYVVIDRRITQLPPRFGYYFAPQERTAPTYGQPFPRGQVRKLDDVRSLSLIYDNGNIAIYGPVASAVEPPRKRR
jgi:hypothetical protein